MNATNIEVEPQSEAETIAEALGVALAESSPPLAPDIARMIEDIQADPDNDELWEQAQTFLKERASAATQGVSNE